MSTPETNAHAVSITPAPAPAPLLTREQILAADDLKSKVVKVPEWGGSVRVRCMTGAQRDSWEAAVARDPTADVRARLCASCICDESGKLLFNMADLVVLGAKSAAGLQRVFNAAIGLNRVTKSDIDELEKNS